MASWFKFGTTVLLSVVSIALLAFSTYAVHQTSRLYIPITTLTETLAIILPILNLLLLGITALSSKLDDKFKLALGWVVSLFESALIVLAASQASDPNLDCILKRTWQKWYSEKAENEIRTIQNRLECCGLRTTRNQAWPFPDRTHNDTACEVLYGRRDPCIERWGNEAVKDLKIMVVVGIVALVAKVLLLLVLSWITRSSPQSTSATGNGHRYFSFTQDAGRILPDEEYHDEVDNGDRTVNQRA